MTRVHCPRPCVQWHLTNFTKIPVTKKLIFYGGKTDPKAYNLNNPHPACWTCCPPSPPCSACPLLLETACHWWTGWEGDSLSSPGHCLHCLARLLLRTLLHHCGSEVFAARRSTEDGRVFKLILRWLHLAVLASIIPFLTMIYWVLILSISLAEPKVFSSILPGKL